MIKKMLKFEDVSEGGERVTHLCKNDVYYAHLSIYNFALNVCKGKTVLDAGSGAGYGSAFLAEHGAKFVHAFDIEKKAVLFSRQNFTRPNLNYQVMGIEKITGFAPKSLDVIFSSNALEHVPNVYPFFRSAWQLLRPDGILIIAVPPVIDEISRTDNINNAYHLNIWTPLQWYHVLNQYFEKIQPYIHYYNKPGTVLDFNNTPDQTSVNETDFTFIPVPLDELFHQPTLTVVFTAQNPRPENLIPPPTDHVTFIDDSFTRPAKKADSIGLWIKKSQEIQRQEGFLALWQRGKAFLIRRIRR